MLFVFIFVHSFVFQGFLPKEGQYTKELVQLAQPPLGSDEKDSNLCPKN